MNYSKIMIFLASFVIFSSCNNDERLPELRTEKTNKVDALNLTKGAFSMDINGEVDNKIPELRGLTEDPSNANKRAYPRKLMDLRTFKLQGKAIKKGVKGYNETLGGDEQVPVYLYARALANDKYYTSGLVTGLARYEYKDGKGNVKLYTNFSLKADDGTMLSKKDAEGKDLEVIALIGGTPIPETNKVFLSSVGNTLHNGKLTDADGNEFYPPLVMKTLKVKFSGGVISIKDSQFRPYGAIIGFNIKNPYSDRLPVNGFAIKTNAFSTSGAVDLEEPIKRSNLNVDYPIHTASDKYNNLKDYNNTNVLSPGVTARNSSDKELVTNQLSNVEGVGVNNLVYIQYKLEAQKTLDGDGSLNKDQFPYVWVIPNQYDAYGVKFDNMCNEIYGAIISDKGVGTYNSMISPKAEEKYSEPVLSESKSYFANVGDIKDTPNLMFKRVYLGAFNYRKNSHGNDTGWNAGSDYTDSGVKYYKYSDFERVYDKQLNMVEVYNPTNTPCDMSKYFLMAYTGYDKSKKSFTYLTIHGAKGESTLKDLSNALMMPLYAGKDTRQCYTIDMAGVPGFLEGSIDYYSAELSGKNKTDLLSLEKSDYQRYGAAAFYTGSATPVKDNTGVTERLAKMDKLPANTSFVYMGAGTWYWLMHNKDEGYANMTALDPFGSTDGNLGGAQYHGNSYNDRSFVAINDAYCSKSYALRRTSWDQNHFGDYMEKDQEEEGCPSMPNNAKDAGRLTDNVDSFFHLQYTEGTNGTKPIWTPGIMGISPGGGFILVKMEEHYIYQTDESGRVTGKQKVFLPEIVDMTPSSANDDLNTKNFGSTKYGSDKGQPANKSDDFNTLFKSILLVKKSDQIQPNIDLDAINKPMDQNTIWKKGDRSVGNDGDFGW